MKTKDGMLLREKIFSDIPVGKRNKKHVRLSGKTCRCSHRKTYVFFPFPPYAAQRQPHLPLTSFVCETLTL